MGKEDNKDELDDTRKVARLNNTVWNWDNSVEEDIIGIRRSVSTATLTSVTSSNNLNDDNYRNK